MDTPQDRTWIGNALPCDVEGAAMTDTGKHQAGTDRHRRRISTSKQLDRNVPLIEIHRNEGIEALLTEHQIGTHRAIDIEALPAAVGPAV